MNRNNVSVDSTINEPKESFLEKIKKSRKEIVIGGIFVGTITICGMIIFKNRDVMRTSTFVETEKFVAPIDTLHSIQTNISIEPLSELISVQGHPRNLPKGYHASQSQIELAKSFGIDLEFDKTFVRPYLRMKNAS